MSVTPGRTGEIRGYRALRKCLITNYDANDPDSVEGDVVII